MVRADYRTLLNEAEIQEQLVGLLRTFGREDICWWACPNGDWRTARAGWRLKKQGVRPGAADLMFMIDGMFHGLELKTEIGSQSANQIEFQNALRRAGGKYYLAKGLVNAVAILIELKAFRAGFKFTGAAA